MEEIPVSNFDKLMQAERKALLEQREKLVGDKERIEAKINDVDVELAAMSAFDVTKSKLVKMSSTKAPTKAKVQAVVKSTAQATAKPARKPKAKTAKPAAAAAAAAPSAAAPAKAAARTAAKKPAAKTAAKPAATKAAGAKPGAARPARKPAPASGSRDKLIALLESNPQGLKRADILTKLKVKGDKKQETSISNILADMKKKSAVQLDNGIYVVAKGKANGAAHA